MARFPRQHTENLKVFQTWPCSLTRKMGSRTNGLICLEQKKTATKVVAPGFRTLASLATGYQGYEDKMVNGLAITSWWIPLGRSQQTVSMYNKSKKPTCAWEDFPYTKTGVMIPGVLKKALVKSATKVEIFGNGLVTWFRVENPNLKMAPPFSGNLHFGDAIMFGNARKLRRVRKCWES